MKEIKLLGHIVPVLVSECCNSVLFVDRFQGVLVMSLNAFPFGYLLQWPLVRGTWWEDVRRCAVELDSRLVSHFVLSECSLTEVHNFLRSASAFDGEGRYSEDSVPASECLAKDACLICSF